MRDSVTARVLAVLAVFSAERPELNLTEISRRARLPLTTTHRIVAELAAWGALERSDEGRYRIGLRLWEVGLLAPRGLDLRELAMPFLEDVYEVTGRTCSSPSWTAPRRCTWSASPVGAR